MLKKIFLPAMLIVALNFSVAVAALNPSASVIDNVGLMSAQEVATLNEKIRRVESAHQIKIGVAFVKTTGGRDMATASRELLEKNFRGGLNGSIVLLVNMGQRKYEIDTDAKMRGIVTDVDGIEFLKDKFKSDLSAGDSYGAANNFVDGVDELATFYETNGGAYGTLAPQGFDPAAAAMAVVIALFIGVTIRSHLIGSMSNIRHASQAIDYLKKDTVKFIERRDTFLFMNIKRRPRGGGGRGGGGGGSHGGGHGGGGGSF